MKKIFLTLLIAIVPISALAKDYKVFTGLGFGLTKTTMTGTYISHTLQLSDDSYQNELSLRLGLKDEDSRIYTSFQYIDNEETIYSLMLNLEALSTPYVINNANLTIFGGVQVGILDIDIEDAVDKMSSSTAMAYGLQGGVLLNISKNIDLETGYKILWSSWSAKSKLSNINFDYNKNIYFALNYTF